MIGWRRAYRLEKEHRQNVEGRGTRSHTRTAHVPQGRWWIALRANALLAKTEETRGRGRGETRIDLRENVNTRRASRRMRRMVQEDATPRGKYRWGGISMHS